MFAIELGGGLHVGSSDDSNPSRQKVVDNIANGEVGSARQPKAGDGDGANPSNGASDA